MPCFFQARFLPRQSSHNECRVENVWSFEAIKTAFLLLFFKAVKNCFFCWFAGTEERLEQQNGTKRTTEERPLYSSAVCLQIVSFENGFLI